MSAPGRNWRSSGGIGRSASQNITSSNTSTFSNAVVSGKSFGQNNSKTVFTGHVDLSDNSLLNVGCIYFSDGTVQCTAGGSSSRRNVIGPTELNEIEIYTGPTGPTGPQGVPGLLTEIHSTGSTGPTGPPGISNETQCITLSTNLSADLTSPYNIGGTLTNITTNQITTIYNTPFAPGNNHLLLTINFLSVSERVASVTATIRGTVVNETTGVPSTVIEEIYLTSINSASTSKTLNKWYHISQIEFSSDSGSINSIDYNIDILGYIDFSKTNVTIKGYRLEVLGNADNSTSDIGIRLIKISQSGSATDIENISVDGNGGSGTGEIVDSLRTGLNDRGYIMPSDSDIWPPNTNFVLSSRNFDSFFNNNENVIVGTNNEGLIIQLTSTAFGGSNGPRYASIHIYYSFT